MGMHHGILAATASQAAFLTVRSYVSTARKHQVNPLHALRQLFQGSPWLPAPAEA